MNTEPITPFSTPPKRSFLKTVATFAKNFWDEMGSTVVGDGIRFALSCLICIATACFIPYALGIWVGGDLLGIHPKDPLYVWLLGTDIIAVPSILLWMGLTALTAYRKTVTVTTTTHTETVTVVTTSTKKEENR